MDTSTQDRLVSDSLVYKEIGERALAIVPGIGIAIGQMLQESQGRRILLDPLCELPVLHVRSLIAAIVVGIARVDDHVSITCLNQSLHILCKDLIFH